MKTWSAEELFIRAYSFAAVGVQAVLDAATTVERITRPPAGCIGCGKRDCGEKCANAAYYRGAEQLAERETEEEVSEPLMSRYGLGPLCAGCRHLMSAHAAGMCFVSFCNCSSADGSAQGPAERPPEVDSFPPNPSGGPPAHPDDAGAEWVGWAVPAICEVLANHQPEESPDGIACLYLDSRVHGDFDDWQAWHEHVAPWIAVHLESALAHEFPASK